MFPRRVQVPGEVVFIPKAPRDLKGDEFPLISRLKVSEASLHVFQNSHMCSCLPPCTADRRSDGRECWEARARASMRGVPGCDTAPDRAPPASRLTQFPASWPSPMTAVLFRLRSAKSSALPSIGDVPIAFGGIHECGGERKDSSCEFLFLVVACNPYVISLENQNTIVKREKLR